MLCAVALIAASGARAESSLEERARAQIKGLQVASPYRISEHALAGKIRYELAFTGGNVSLPETGEQHVEQRGDRWNVTICRNGCGREAAPGDIQLNHFLQPNAWVQSNDEVIVGFSRIGPLSASFDDIMRSLVKTVAERMSGPMEFQHYWSAREAYDNQSGDCTEFAVLLAAATRARGIPARLVAGLAYSSRFLGVQHAFGPHMWVQAWNGERWVSYDAGLGEFDAGHLALVLGDGRPSDFAAVNGAIRRLRIISALGLVPTASAH
jgi:hypothetical protein